MHPKNLARIASGQGLWGASCELLRDQFSRSRRLPFERQLLARSVLALLLFLTVVFAVKTAFPIVSCCRTVLLPVFNVIGSAACTPPQQWKLRVLRGPRLINPPVNTSTTRSPAPVFFLDTRCGKPFHDLSPAPFFLFTPAAGPPQTPANSSYKM